MMEPPKMTTCVTRPSTLVRRERAGSSACLVRIYPHSIDEGIIDLPQRELLIGRSKNCQIELDDPAVSRKHACIHHSAAGYRISDLGSVNSTFVNDFAISEAALQSGDLVRIGHTIFKFLLSDDIEKQFHEEIYSMLITDGLTRTANRRYFLETFEREFTRSRRHRRPLSLVMFDVDHFKQINDAHGHLTGDLILRDLCSRVRAFVRQDQVFARYGGEEFALVLPEEDEKQTLVLCEKILATVNQQPFAVAQSQVFVTISMGVQQMDRAVHLCARDLIAAADSKLYQAKAKGRNRIVY